jgi:two-component system cell cycle sensor histidine kinase/response regulator CckA
VRISEQWQPIGRKLPILITALLCVVVAVFSWSAYDELQRALVTAAGERVTAVSRQLGGVFGDAGGRLKRDGSPVAKNPVIKRALTEPSPAALADAGKVLTAEKVGNKQIVVVDLWDVHGTRLAVTDTAGEALISVAAPVRALFPEPIGPLLVAHDSVVAEVRIPVFGEKGDTIGFLREITRLSNKQSGDLVTKLIGGNAVMAFGNVKGDLWTDLVGRVPAPTAAHTPGVPLVSKAGDGTETIGALWAVPNSPWLVWVALPRGAVTEQARKFLYRMLAIAAVVIVLGAIAARALSRHIIAPLAAVTVAAEGIAAGDYSRRVKVARDDEVGRMSAAFNEMTARIQEATYNLEAQQTELEAQQAELEATNQDLQESADSEARERLAAERSGARTAAVLKGAIDCIISMDQDGRIVDFNPAAERTFGFAATDAIGQLLHELIIPESRRAAYEGGMPQLALEDSPDASERRELIAMRADRTEFPVELTIARVPLEDSPIYTAFLHDVSQQKALEAQLQQSQKMEAVGRLAGGVAHDFNNILTVILTYADILFTNQDMSEEARHDIAQVSAAADRATQLTRQLLAFSRKQVLHPTVLELNGIVGDMQSMLSRVIQEDVRLETRLGANVGAVKVDRNQVEQVLMNLAVNARDAMPNGGSLIIETANVELDEAYAAMHSGSETGPHVVLTVSDTGEGMDAATRDRIFEPFFTTKGPGKGTGLGLATVYGIVQQSGGSIYVYSEPGRGTTFKVYFPRHAKLGDVVEAAPEPPTSAPFAASVLLVEDDPSVRGATRLLLERLGYSVIEAPGVTVALELVRSTERRIQVVVTDAVMPGLSGLDLAEILAAERPEIPVLLVSGYTEDVVNHRGQLRPNVAFLEKPFTAVALSRAMAGVLDKSMAPAD